MTKITPTLSYSHNTWLHIFLIATISALVFARLIHYGFVNYDDDIYLQNGVITGGITIPSILKSFTSVINDNWNPITVLSLMLDSQIYGPHSAYGFHATNILIHIFNSILVYAFFRKISRDTILSLFMAILFAVHPLQVETVAWVSERKGLLAAFFFLASLISYLKFRTNDKKGLYFLSLILFVFGLLSKAVVVALPIILLLIEWMYIQNRGNVITRKKMLLYVSPFLVISFLIGVLTIIIQNKSGVLTNTNILPLSTRILNALLSIKVYLAQTIFPEKLSVFYPYLKSYPLYLLAIYFVGFIAISYSAIYLYLKNKLVHPLFGWLWFLLMLLPVIGLIQTGVHAHADRYMYLPIIGLLIIFMELAIFIRRKNFVRTPILRTIAVSILLIYSGVAWFQAGVWKNTETLFLHANAVTNRNYIADTSLALFYLKNNENKKAWHYYLHARAAEPKYATLYTAITYQLLKQKKYGAVTLVNKQMIEAGVRVEDGYRIIAQILLNSGKYQKSITDFNKALKLNPKDYYSLYGISYAYYKLKKYNIALDYLKKTDITKNNDPKLLRLFGDIYMAKGDKLTANNYYSIITKGSKTPLNSNKAQQMKK